MDKKRKRKYIVNRTNTKYEFTYNYLDTATEKDFEKFLETKILTSLEEMD